MKPATHFASRLTDANLPPMGMRVRLKAGFDVSRFPAPVQVILTALKKHGMLLADNGSDWFISGAPDPRWDVEQLATLKRVKGRDLEVVRMGELVTRQATAISRLGARDLRQQVEEAPLARA